MILKQVGYYNCVFGQLEGEKFEMYLASFQYDNQSGYTATQ
jgi:hypothetical protein